MTKFSRLCVCTLCFSPPAECLLAGEDFFLKGGLGDFTTTEFELSGVALSEVLFFTRGGS